ncbi:hypothetical protein OJAV_G00214640 [Oryzias javanicus]|uniref:DnaJ homolog subfamily C member 30, mitochondrial n=1 Tax=Oryzias javanicus TaxID=123683 RepID=A0A3S2LZW1_ORYJA|nr:hypothetical protein OJAV_G00214640 [Oryzias javanicus]
MAEVSRRFGTGSLRFALQQWDRCPQTKRQRHGRRAANTSWFSIGFVLNDIGNCGRNGLKMETTDGFLRTSRYGYITLKPLPGSVDVGSDTGHIMENVPIFGFEKNHSMRFPTVKRHFVRNQSFTSLWSALRSPRNNGCRGNGSAFIREFSSNGSRAEPLHKTKTGYYEVLGVTTVATQAQIKTAYYKQSFIYHPDRNAGSDDATARFSEISEAYTVLGNKALRRKYDRGLLSAADLTAAVRPSAKDTPGSTAKSGDSRHSVGRAGTQGGTFDFDQFYKSHYNEQLQRQQEIRVRKEEMLKRKTDTVGDKKLGRMFEIAVGMLLIFALGLIKNLNKG